MSTRTQIDLHMLIEKAQYGETEAFQRIFELFSNRLFAYALSRTRHREDALDIVQETFIDLWTALEQFTYSSDEEFFSFVFTILKRKLSQFFKKRNVVVQLNEKYIAESYDISYPDYQYIEKLLAELPEQDQELLRLRYWNDLPFSDIATLMNMNENAVKVRHHRALAKLKNITNSLHASYASQH